MADNDIRKAKEYFTYGIIHDIFSAPVISHAKTALLAFEEINRQKAKIKALEMDNSQLQSDIINANMNCEHMQAEIERLRGGILDVTATLGEFYGEIVTVSKTDNLVKEMVGERE